MLTNGCFDLVHVGHIRYLRQARALGDALAVAINSDSSTRILKGPSRPIVTEGERAELLAALESVDFVTIFDEPTASETVEAVRPDIYVKGGDYSANPEDPRYPPEARVAASYGGQFVVLPYVPGRSTTSLIDRLSGESS